MASLNRRTTVQELATRRPLGAAPLMATALIMSVAGCGDSVTDPGGTAGRVPSPATRTAPNVFVVTRDVLGPNGVTTRTLWRVPASALPTAAAADAASRSSALAATAGRIAPGLALSRGAGAAGAELSLVPALRERARPATMLCADARPWRYTLAVGTEDNVTAEISGVGDAPASTVRILRRGTELATTTTEWVRRRTSWDVSRRVTTVGGRVVDAIRVAGASPATGGDEAEAYGTVARVACDGDQPPLLARAGDARLGAPAVAPTALAHRAPERVPAMSGFVGPVGSAFRRASDSPSYADSWCDGGGDWGEDPDPCRDYRWRYGDKVAVAQALAGAAVAACAIPEPVEPIACGLAVAAYYAAMYQVQQARDELNACLERNKPKPKMCCPRTPAHSISGNDSGVGHGATDDRPTLIDEPPTQCYPIGGGGSGGGEMALVCHAEIWEISFDGGDSWNPFQVTVCEYQMM